MQLALSLPRATLSDADRVIEMLAHNAGGSAPIQAITSVRRSAGHAKESFVADVRMFDGRPGRVRLERFRDGPVVQRWLKLPGGAIELKGGKWRRVKAVAA